MNNTDRGTTISDAEESHCCYTKYKSVDVSMVTKCQCLYRSENNSRLYKQTLELEEIILLPLIKFNIYLTWCFTFVF